MQYSHAKGRQIGIRIHVKQGIRLFSVISVLLFAFCVLKVLRGADTANESAGGIWNYISLVYYPLFLFHIIRRRRTIVRDFFIFSFLFVLFAVIGVVLSGTLSLSTESIYGFLMIPYPFLVMSVFYVYADDNLFAHRVILLTYYVCLLLNFITIVRHQFFSYERAMASDVYFSLCLYPFCLLLEKYTPVRIVAFVIQFFSVFTADKRAGFIAFVIGIIGYLLIFNSQRGRNHLLAAIRAVLIVAAIVLLLYLVTSLLDQQFHLNIYSRLLRSGEDEGSGRVHIYQRVWNDYLRSDLPDKILGHGKGMLKAVTGSPHAHNDFLEALYVYGVIPAVCLVLFYVALIVRLIKLILRRSRYAAAFFYSVVIGVTLSMLSFFLIFYTYVTGLVAFWGYTLYMERQEERGVLTDGEP